MNRFSIKAFFPVIMCILSVILQAMVAPSIAISSVVPNFCVAICVGCCAAMPYSVGLVAAFVTGFAFDLLSSGPLGSMAFILVAITFALSLLVDTFGSDNLIMDFVFILVAVVIADLVFGLFCLTVSTSVNFLDALIYRFLPCMLYDTILAIVFFLLARLVANIREKQSYPRSYMR